MCYEEGKGVEQSYEEAEKWYRKAMAAYPSDWCAKYSIKELQRKKMIIKMKGIMKNKKVILAVVAVVIGMIVVGGVGVIGANGQQILSNPPVSITMRDGFLSEYVLQVHNLSALESVAFRVCVTDGQKSSQSPKVVVAPNGIYEIGKVEMNDWAFQAGERGYVYVDGYRKKLFFEVYKDGQYSTWFSF